MLKATKLKAGIFILSLLSSFLVARWSYSEDVSTAELQQDACTFGAVPNARYQELLVEAKHRETSHRWAPFDGGNRDMEDNLTYRVEDLTSGMTSVEERLASMHAVARALGAEYRTTEPDDPDPYANRTKLPAHLIYFNYTLDVRRLGRFAVFAPTALFHFSLNASVDLSESKIITERTDSVYAVVFWPNFLSPAPKPLASHYNRNCPPMPSEAWKRAHNIWIDQNR